MTDQYLVSCILVKEKEREVGSSVVVLWQERHNELRDAENNTRTKLAVTVQSGKDHWV